MPSNLVLIPGFRAPLGGDFYITYSVSRGIELHLVVRKFYIWRKVVASARVLHGTNTYTEAIEEAARYLRWLTARRVK